MASLPPVSVAQEITASWHQQVTQSSNTKALYSKAVYISLLVPCSKGPHLREVEHSELEHSAHCSLLMVHVMSTRLWTFNRTEQANCKENNLSTLY